MSSRRSRTPRSQPATSSPVIIISDDECDESPSSSDPLPCPQPIAEIAPGQEFAIPDSGSVKGILQRIENGLKQAISIIEVKWGTFKDSYSFITDELEKLQRIGGKRLADLCEVKLADWLILAYYLDDIVYSDSHNEVERLVRESRAKASHERMLRERKISLQRGTISDLHLRLRHLQRQIGYYNDAVTRTGVRTIQGEKTLRSFQRECERVQGFIDRETPVLQTMLQEHAAAITASSEEALKKEAEAQVQAKREMKLATAKADLATFTVLDLC